LNISFLKSGAAIANGNGVHPKNSMGLLTEKDFKHDSTPELTRYNDLRELGFSEDEARSSSAGLGDPWTLWFELPHDCFLCHERLMLPFIYWLGVHNQMIGLHIKCAEHFAKAITADLRRA
jgi:hypothetical protein